MSRYVKLSWASAERLDRYLLAECVIGAEGGLIEAVRELRAAVRPATPSLAKPPKRPPKTPAFKSRRPSKSSKREEQAETRATLEVRAGGYCEACRAAFSPSDPPEDDHILGRARARGVEAEWLIHRGCHRAKTDNKPSAAYWLEKALLHCVRYGYAKTADAIRARLAGIITIRDTEKTRRAHAPEQG